MIAVLIGFVVLSALCFALMELYIRATRKI